jgi:hypothetical protein
MPYSKAHYYLISLLLITVIAFWDSYFGKLLDAPLAHHLHGITATFWIILLAVQSWLIHQKKRDMHRKFGKLVFIMAPLMLGAFALVILAGAHKSVAMHPFYVQFGQALILVDVLLLFSTALQIYLAFKLRHNVRLHSALIFGTLIGLLPPIISRLALIIPALSITSLETMYKFKYGLHFGFAFSFMITIILYIKYRKDGWPWLLATGIMAVSYLLYLTVGQMGMWQNIVYSIAILSPYLVYFLGFLIGLVACMLGWQQGKKVKTG